MGDPSEMNGARNPEIKNAFEHLLTSFLFLAIPLGVSFWTVTGTLDQYTQFRWLILYGVCGLLVAGSFFSGFQIRIPAPSANRWLYAGVSGLVFFTGIATLRSFPGTFEIQMLEWACFFVLLLWSYALSVDRDSRNLLLRSIRFANRLGLLGVGLYLVAQQTGHSWSYLVSVQGHEASLFGHKNFAGSFFAVAILIEIVGSDWRARGWRRVGSGILVLLGLYGLYCARARGATLGFAIALLFLGLKNFKSKTLWKWWIAGILVLALAYAVAVLSYRKEENGSNTRDIRIARWLNTLSMMADHPLGIGPGRYEFDYLPYNRSVRVDVEIDGRYVSKTPHNMPLQIGVEYGMPALLFWFLLTALLLKWAWKSPSGEGAVLVCILIDGLFAFPLHVTHSFVSYAVFIGILMGRSLPSRNVPSGAGVAFAKSAVFAGISWVTFAVYSAVMAESYDINHYESMKISCDRAPWRFYNCIHLARIQGNQGSFTDGIRTCMRLIERQPNGYPAYLILSELYRLSGNDSLRCESLSRYDSILGGKTQFHEFVRKGCPQGSEDPG